jgi:hypothetical protein
MGDRKQPADPTRAKLGGAALQPLFGKAAKTPAGGQNYPGSSRFMASGAPGGRLST